jgi:hypothetical protein
MSYYRGDYYRGDYYQGFPFALAAIGLGKKLLGKVAPKVGAAIGKIAGRGGGKIGPVLKKGGTIAAAGGAFEIGSRVTRRVLNGGDEAPRRRRMNVTNVKALRRAIRRAHGFAKLSRKVLSFPISKPPKGRPLFKKQGRRR